MAQRDGWRWIRIDPPGNWERTPQCFALVIVLFFLFLFPPVLAAQQAPARKNALILLEMGWSHPGVSVVTQELVSSLLVRTNFQVEFYSESLDSTVFSDESSQREMRDWLAYKYRNIKLDAIIAAGPGPVKFLANSAAILFPKVPIVFCAAPEELIRQSSLNSRFTGTWLTLEPDKTVDAALNLFPETRHIVVVSGTSGFDKGWLAVLRAGLRSFESRFDVTYLTDLEMPYMLARIKHLPEHSVVIFATFFRDAAGNQFINTTYALPLISQASNAPVFGMSDTYIGHGIVGGFVMSFAEQGKIASDIVAEILGGKRPEQVSVVAGQNRFAFDWKEMQRWHIKESALPPGSIVYFRELSFWQRTSWIWITSLSIILILSALVAYLQRSRKQLRLAKDRQLQLSGMLISAQEKERSRLASELHDDFSQRLALLALGLETAAEAISVSPGEAERQLHDLLNSASELGSDLHTLSHQLHSSTLGSLGLVPAVNAFCKEFQAQQGMRVEFSHREIPRSVHPDVGLCLFRIVQEGLRNTKKHSGAAAASVCLETLDGRIHLSVSDDGAGFDLHSLSQCGGLGVRSMRERARLLGGQFEIRSELGKGTKVEAWVPFQPEPTLVNR